MLTRRALLMGLLGGAMSWLPFIGREVRMPVLPNTEQLLTFFVPVISGYNSTDMAEIGLIYEWGVALAENKVCTGRAWFIVPHTGLYQIKPILFTDDTGDCECATSYLAGAVGENFSQHSGNSGAQTIAVTVLKVNAGPTLTMSLTAGDVMQLLFARDGTAVTDTVYGNVYPVGFEVTRL